VGYFDDVKKKPAAEINQQPAQISAEGLHPYAAAAISAELGRLDALARPWHQGAGWDTITYEVACNLIEISNSAWSGYSQAQAHADLHAHAATDGVWGTKEVEAKWKSARLKIGPGNRPEPTAMMSQVQEVASLEITEGIGATVVSPGEELAFWGERDLLRHIHTYAQARMMSPWATLGGVLARVLALTPPAMHLPAIIGSRQPLNFGLAVVGPSGAGKGGAEGLAEEAINWPFIPFARIGSGEAIAHTLKRRIRIKDGDDHDGTEWVHDGHNILISMTEVDKLVGQARRQGSTIMAELRAAWSGEALGHITADQSRRIPVPAGEYRCCLILGVQPLRAAGLLDDADGGFPQRLIWLPAIDPAPPETEPACPKPISWEPPRVPNFVTEGDDLIVCDWARKEVIEARRAANRGLADPLDGHLLLTRLKVAAALAILDQRWSIEDDDWRLAGIVITRSNAQRAAIQAELAAVAHRANIAAGAAEGIREVAKNEIKAEKAVPRISSRIRRRLSTEDWTSKSVIRKTMLGGPDRPYAEEALAALLKAGDIEAQEHNGGLRYRLKPDALRGG
jgi:hypothetical protein